VFDIILGEAIVPWRVLGYDHPISYFRELVSRDVNDDLALPNPSVGSPGRRDLRLAPSLCANIVKNAESLFGQVSSEEQAGIPAATMWKILKSNWQQRTVTALDGVAKPLGSAAQPH
jgi:hypothetical protein